MCIYIYIYTSISIYHGKNPLHFYKRPAEIRKILPTSAKILPINARPYQKMQTEPLTFYTRKSCLHTPPNLTLNLPTFPNTSQCKYTQNYGAAVRAPLGTCGFICLRICSRSCSQRLNIAL